MYLSLKSRSTLPFLMMKHSLLTVTACSNNTELAQPQNLGTDLCVSQTKWTGTLHKPGKTAK